jgi:hypothetical protein
MSDHSGWLLVSSDARTFKGTKDRRFLVLRPSERAISIYKKQEDVVKVRNLKPIYWAFMPLLSLNPSRQLRDPLRR